MEKKKLLKLAENSQRMKNIEKIVLHIGLLRKMLNKLNVVVQMLFIQIVEEIRLLLKQIKEKILKL